MKWYIVLQIRMFNRHLKDFGVPPLLAYPILVFLFVFFSNFIFYALDDNYDVYIYLLWAISTLLKLSENKRNNFLKLSFTRKIYLKIRALENLLFSTPFALYLLIKQHYWYVLLLYCLGLLLSSFKITIPTSLVIPTPFGKKPFEFSSGFRKTFYMFPLIYWLTYKSITVGNFNLGIFSLLLLFFTVFTFYSKTENEYCVWIFNKSPKKFIIRKIKTGITYVLFLSMPISLVLTVFFIEHIVIIIVFQLLGILYFTQVIIAKYADFPQQINLPSSMIFVLSMSFPPLILFTFRYFYDKSIQKTSPFLDDKH